MAEDLLKEPLPDPWTFGVTNDGRVFFINDEDKKTTWLHPDTGEAIRSGFVQNSDLPSGWEEGFTETGAVYYINHNKGTTTFAFPQRNEEIPKSLKKPKKTEEPLYQNVNNETLREEKKKRRSSSFLERSANLFRRSSSKSRERPEQHKQRPSRKMKEKREKPEKKSKAARPTSATSVKSNQSFKSVNSKMTASWRDPAKEIVTSGWLYKQDSTGKMKMWRKKWFVLADYCLYYYKDSKEEEILGSIILPSYTVSTMTADDKISRKYAFKVEHAGMRTYYLSADTYKDMVSWITALQKCCHPLSQKKEKPKEAEVKKVEKPTESKTPKEEKPKKEEPVEKREENDESKGTDGSKRKKKDSLSSKPEEDSDSEFGFNHVRVHPPASIGSSQSTPKPTTPTNMSSNNNIKHERNGQLPSDGPRSKSPKRVEQPHNIMPRKEQDNYQQRSAHHSPTKQDYRQSNRDPRHNRSGRRPDSSGPNLRQHPQQKNARKENGESAYFSDTSGATDSSGRFANSSDRSNPQQGQQPTANGHGKVKRQDSLVKLGNWVMNQKMRQSGSALNSPQRTGPPSNFDTASEFSSVSQQYTRKSATMSAKAPNKSMGPPPSSRRYRARTYNEYMDPMEVASSTISMPPMQHMNRMYVTQTLPRPQSTEEVDKLGRPIHRGVPGQQMVSSKSAGNIVAVDQYGNPISPSQSPRGKGFDNSKRAKSDYVFQNGDDLQQQYIASFKKAQSKETQAFHAPRQQQKSYHRPQSAGRSSNSSSGGRTPRGHQQQPKSAITPNDVFSPRSNASSGKSPRNDEQIFRFDGQNRLSPYGNTRRPDTLSPSQQSNAQSPYEVKQVQRGQLRAFVVSARSPQAQLPPPERQTPLKAKENVPKVTRVATDRDIEAKLKKLNETEKVFQQISNDVANLQSDRERIEADLSISRSKMQNRYGTVDTQQHRLEQELGNVKAQLASAAEKLKNLSRDNDIFQQEMRKFKSSIVEELRNQRSPADDVYNTVSNQEKEVKRRLESELGRIEFIIEGLSKQKSAITGKLNELDRGRDDDSPLLSPTSPPSLLSANGRSPRDVKRSSMERRSTNNRPSYSSTSSSGTPNSTPVKKYFTLPGRGVPHATSVDSVTADSLVRSRPTSARSVSSIGSSSSNLQRTRSAAERLFNAPYGNQGSDHEAKEIKRLQKEILRNRRNNLKSAGSVGDSPRRHSNPTGMTLPARSHMKVGIDVQMALKHHRMPKVLQRAKRDRAEAMHNQIGFEIDELERNVTGKTKSIPIYTRSLPSVNHDEVDGRVSPDIEPEEIHVDVNLTHQTTGVVTSRAFSSCVGSGSGYSSARRSYARVTPPKAASGRAESKSEQRRETCDGRVFISGGGHESSNNDPGSRIHSSVYRMMV